MNRDQSYLKMLNAAANMQWNVAMILEAKAVEAEKMRSWLLHHVSPDAFADHESQLKTPLDVHEHVLESVEGLTKMCRGLNGVLKAVLGDSGGGDGEDGGGLGGMFGGSFELEDR